MLSKFSFILFRISQNLNALNPIHDIVTTLNHNKEGIICQTHHHKMVEIFSQQHLDSQEEIISQPLHRKIADMSSPKYHHR